MPVAFPLLCPSRAQLSRRGMEVPDPCGKWWPRGQLGLMRHKEKYAVFRVQGRHPENAHPHPMIKRFKTKQKQRRNKKKESTYLPFHSGIDTLGPWGVGWFMPREGQLREGEHLGPCRGHFKMLSQYSNQLLLDALVLERKRKPYWSGHI